ncbi:hypothetical protein COB11_08685 [Candidatus Aerophobetes bacterium]|uniref:Uncharacterized protein n=1 Tax=Aerophobetes bacterium TaxID=2030807 RepID=A0A2A4Y8U2_UNCAE|nr:MAG: hypothetical protein COB11_08685 [Candidatus Aerophobetes bacterium]
MGSIAGIGKKSRIRLGKVLMQCPSNLITPEKVIEILNISQIQAKRLLQYWVKNGWLHRVRRGLYQPVPLEASTSKIAIEDLWVVAQELFSPCYIGGWSAIEFWNLTEQIFQTVLVVTSRRFSRKNFEVSKNRYILKKKSEEHFFGLKNIWRNKVRVRVSDPSRTIIDLLNDPSLVGGMRQVIDFFKEYLKSDHKSLGKLLEYGDKMKNRTIFKRLGFILEAIQPQEKDIIQECERRISKGKSQFDPQLKGSKSTTKWRLFIPLAFCKLDTETLYD